MKPIWIIVGYVVISVILYFVMAVKCKRNPVFKAPRSPTVFYALSFTWGLPSILIGSVVAAVLFIAGNKSKKYGWEWYFELPNINWGLELGIFFIAPKGKGRYEGLKMHEHGHGIQNIYLGIFNPLVVSLPSALRFWYRKFREAIGKPCETEYDNVWFEGSASMSGHALMCRLRDSEKTMITDKFVEQFVENS